MLESAVPEVEVLEHESSTSSAPTPTPTASPRATAAPPVKTDLYIDNTSETSKDAAGKFVVPSQLAKGARRRKSSRRGGSSRSDSSRSSSRSSGHDSSSRDTRRHDADHGGIELAPPNDPSRQTNSDTYRNGSTSESASSSVDSSEHSDDFREHEARRRSQPDFRSDDDQAHRSTRHRDRRAEAGSPEPSPVVVFLKIVGGGLLALPLAYLIVMWIFSRDPLGIGESLGEKVPFLVPSALRADDDDSETSTDDAPKAFQGDLDSLTPDAIDSGFEDLKIGEEALQDFDN